MISHRAAGWSPQYGMWSVLLLTAGIPRLVAAFLLPNEEGDPYAYVQAIEMMRASIAGGTFTISELFGFWLPLYQFICALLSVFAGHPLYTAKVVSAVCGTGVCLLVYEITNKLTANRMLAFFAFALIALNPIHVMYSAFSMSDVPHAFLVMGSLYFVLRDRWVLAASLAALGGLTRPESWMFIVLLPALQYLLHRRFSPTAFFVAVSSPLIWIYISWSATGNAFEYFNVRSNYIRELLSKDPSLASFSPPHVIANLQTLLYSTGHAVIVACLIALWLVIRRIRSQSNRGICVTASALVINLAYFFSSLGFLLCAYFTNNQPAIFARYCLVIFALGLPILAWILLEARGWNRVWARSLCTALLVLCVWQWAVQLRDGAGFIKHVSQKRIVANYLRANLDSTANNKVFCDDDTVKTLTGFRGDLFLSSPGSPGDAGSFLDYLKENRVEFLIYERREGSAAQKAFGELGEEEIKRHFQLVASTSTDLRLYRTVF